VSEKLTLTVPVYEELLAHLVDFEERRGKIIDEYYPEYNKQREEFEEFISRYINALDEVVKNVLFSDNANNDFSFVCLYSEVEIEDLDKGETYKYKIISPDKGYVSNDCITFLSPMGKALLCKKVKDTVSVNTPSGVYRYRIKSVRLYQNP
jgi:transcription elongation factor GreA